MYLFFAIGFVLMYLNGILGMGYGTALSPLLLLLGVRYPDAVQAVLLSQGVASVFLAVFHHRHRNSVFHVKLFWPKWKGIWFGIRHGRVLAAFRRRSSHELKVALVMAGLGLVAVFLGAWLSGIIPVPWLKRYLGAVVIVAGLLMIVGFRMAFKPWKLMTLTMVGCLNKILTGGGFGPLLTGGQVMLGEDSKRAVGISSAVQIPLNLAGYAVLGFLHGFSDARSVTLPLLVGACVAAPLASRSLSAASSRSARTVMGFVMIVLGVTAFM